MSTPAHPRSPSRFWYEVPGAIERRFYGVFEGGGAKGVAHVGALQALKERRCWFAGVAGASAGAITAALVAAGLAPEAIRQRSREALALIATRLSPREIGELDDEALARAATGVWAGLRRLRATTGYYSAEGLRDWLDALLRCQVAIQEGTATPVQVAALDCGAAEAVTFARLFAATGIELNVVAADLSTRSQIVFSHHDTPECAVADAVVASAAIPFGFPSRALQVPEASLEEGAALRTIVDGGVWANFPIYVFEDAAFRRCYGREPEVLEPESVLGFVLQKGDPPELPRGKEIRFAAADARPRLRNRERVVRDDQPTAEASRWWTTVATSPLYLLGALGRLLSWNSSVEDGRWPDPRSRAARYLVHSIDGLLAGIHPWLYAVFALAVVATGAWVVGKSLAVDQITAVADLDWSDPMMYATRGVGAVMTLLAIAVAILLVFAAVVGLVANQFLLPASRRILYGLVTTYVAGSGAPHWSAQKDNVVALPIPPQIDTLSFVMARDDREALIRGAREATLAKLDTILDREAPVRVAHRAAG